MANKNRQSVLKREREMRKRLREQSKAEKAALKREHRLEGKDSEPEAPPSDLPSEHGA
ncbi:MAG: hypothetical protein GXP29_02565 [Planctomycetes bacterium]|nr:hypothetical protein [Planctomycetota bacterium]